MSAAPLKVEGSGDWLTDILDAMDGEDTPAMEMAEQLELKDEVLFSLEAQNPGEAGAVDVVDKVGGDAGCDAGSKQRERDTQNSTVVHETRTELNGKLKRSEREKRRRDALNDHFMGLSVLLEPRLTEALKTDKATIVTEAAKVIKALRQQLQQKSYSFREVTEKNSALTKERESILQDKHKLEHQLACFMSSMPFATPVMGGLYQYPGAGVPGAPPAMLKPGQPVMPSMMFAFPPLVMETTTAEEDAKLRAPLA